MRTGPLVGLVALVMCGPLACGGGGGGGGSGTPTSPATPSTPATPPTPATPSTPASPTTVSVENNTFNPGTLTVAAGSTVTWTWDTCSTGYDPYGGATSSCVDHSIVWDAGGTSSPTQSQGTYQRTFATAGTYNYHCAVHGAAMSGKVVVQ
jgi:plastocyanin